MPQFWHQPPWAAAYIVKNAEAHTCGKGFEEIQNLDTDRQFHQPNNREKKLLPPGTLSS